MDGGTKRVIDGKSLIIPSTLFTYLVQTRPSLSLSIKTLFYFSLLLL